MRYPFIAGNWKMNKTIAEGVEFVETIKDQIGDTDVEVALCVPATMLKDLKQAAKGSKVQIGAQNMHYEENGAFTGEIAPKMLTELDIDFVVIGHSERRTYYNETDETVNKKVLKALEVGIKPIMCCGESLEQRESGETKDFVKSQIIAGLKGVPSEKAEEIVIAYEPIWAIGTGKTATSEQANDVIKFIRETLVELFDEEVAEKVRIQYGGSVKPHNVEEIMAQSDIDGALVGGASLKTDSFLELINF